MSRRGLFFAGGAATGSGVAYRQELPMRLTQETLGKARAVLFGIVFALVLIAYALHRLR